MAQTETEIANLALGHLGQSTEIANLQSTRTPEALAIRRIYDTMRRATLRDFAWPFATRIAALGLVEEAPNLEWAFSYREPSDCLLMRKIQSGVRNDNRQSRVPFKGGRDGSGILIYTDKEDAIGEYTIDMTTVQNYPDDFVLALSLRIAAYAAPKICGEDPFKLGQASRQLYQMEIENAKNNAFTGEQREDVPDSELERSRS